MKECKEDAIKKNVQWIAYSPGEGYGCHHCLVKPRGNDGAYTLYHRISCRNLHIIDGQIFQFHF